MAALLISNPFGFVPKISSSSSDKYSFFESIPPELDAFEAEEDERSDGLENSDRTTLTGTSISKLILTFKVSRINKRSVQFVDRYHKIENFVTVSH